MYGVKIMPKDTLILKAEVKKLNRPLSKKSLCPLFNKYL